MRGINQVTLVGRAGTEPIVRTTPRGDTVVRVRLATNRGVQREGVWVQETDWHDVELWGRSAETAARFIRCGEVFGVQGSLRTETWQDDGQHRKKVIVRASRLHLFGRARKAVEPTTEEASQQTSLALVPEAATAPF